VIGAVALTTSYSDRMLGNLLIQYVSQPGVSIGDAIQIAKAQLAASYPNQRDVLLGWTLLGDPYLMVQP